MSNSSLLDDPLAVVQQAIEAGDEDEADSAPPPAYEAAVAGEARSELADVAADAEDLIAIGLATSESPPMSEEDEKKEDEMASPGGTLGPRASALLAGKRRSTLRRRSVDDHLGEIETAMSMPTDLPSASTPLTGDGAMEELPDYDMTSALSGSPPIPMVRTLSLDTGRKEDEKKRKSLRVQNALDGGVLSTKQPTLEILPMARGTSASKNKKEGVDDLESEELDHQGSTVVVPPRSVLLRMPIYSTPLTLESTNNAYRDFVSRLMGMGFELGQSECAVIMTSAESVETAVEFIFQHPDGLWHRFRPSEGTKELLQERNKEKGNTVFEELFEKRDLCEICGLQYWRHYIDPNGEKIKQEGDDVSDVALHGDLLGRVSMSVATREQRQDLIASLQNMDGNRLRMIQQIEEEEEATRRYSSGISVDYLGSSGAGSFTNQQQSNNEPAYSGPMETCMVCFDEKPQSKFLMAVCGHNYCHECLKQHYRVKTRDGDVLKIECIDPKCDREITEEEVKNCLQGDRELLDKFEKFRRDRLLMMDPSTRFCVTPDCDGFMSGNRFRPKMECPVCHVHVCFNCNQPWHGYFVGCNNNVDVATSLWALNKDVQKCPRCKVTIEKAEGCNHMTCQSCKFEFCWICRGPYSSDHFEAWNIFGCPGAQYTPTFCRFPACFPRWLNRMFILLCAFTVAFPFAAAFGTLWMLGVCCVVTVRCGDFDIDDMNPCDMC